jgi:hypothetical protein
MHFFLLVAASFGASSLPQSTAKAATFTIINTDSAGVRFNDTTPAIPVGGNTGTTIGQQRLIAFQFAANIWGSLLASSVTIQVSASFAPLSCNSTSAILGSAGPFSFFSDFTGAPVASTWYPVALANALNGSDLDPLSPDITAQFNGALGTTCSFPQTWYYGLDGKSLGTQIDFVSVLVHELGHGLGFLTLVDLASGAKMFGLNDTFMLNLENHGANPADYPSMTDAQRVTASTAAGNLHWVGANVQSWSGLLTAGAVGTHVRMFAPNPQQPGSSVSHWDTVLTPNQVMEPVYTQPIHRPIMELPLFRDIGWTILQVPHDFNGDGTSDIVWCYNCPLLGDNYFYLWEMNGTHVLNPSTTFIGETHSTSCDSCFIRWAILGTYDFNGDGYADILWENLAGSYAIWEMKGTQVLSSASLLIPNDWRPVLIGDFNGDGMSDLLLQASSDGINFIYAIWEMNGTQVLNSALLGSVPSPWVPLKTGDFNGDGISDILWSDNSGNYAIWEMNGPQILNAESASLGYIPNWYVSSIGDFNGDGMSDILWWDNNGNYVIWEMNGTQVLNPAYTYVANVNLNVWYIQGIGDFNNDGRADILWGNYVSSDNLSNFAIWEMNGTTIINSATLASSIPYLYWSIVVPINVQ